MKLLILTQKIDSGDAVLGFFHRWVEELAKRFEQITVICLFEGTHALPPNVRVLSLGKDKGLSRLAYVRRFYSYIWQVRNEHDAVFVHMNAEYVLLGGFLWHWWGKPVALWYNHTYGDWRARLAFRLADKIFHTSPYAFSSGSAKSERMPAGIDTAWFKPMPEIVRKPRSILYVGRIAEVKRVDVLLDAFVLLKTKKPDATLAIVGSASAADAEYLARLKLKAAEYGSDVEFRGSIANRETPALYNAATVTVNLTPKGNYDKTVLESMACETVVTLSSKAFADMVPPQLMFAEGDAQSLADRLATILNMNDAERASYARAMRRSVVEHHDLGLLAARIEHSMKSLVKPV